MVVEIVFGAFRLFSSPISWTSCNQIWDMGYVIIFAYFNYILGLFKFFSITHNSGWKTQNYDFSQYLLKKLWWPLFKHNLKYNLLVALNASWWIIDKIVEPIFFYENVNSTIYTRIFMEFTSDAWMGWVPLSNLI